MWYFHTRIRHKFVLKIKTRQTKTPITHTVQVRHACIWCKKSLRQKVWDTSLIQKKSMNIQKITGSILCHARSVDPTALMPLNAIVTEQKKSTERTQAAAYQILECLAIHTGTTIRYHASDLIPKIHSDASYLSVSKYCSRLGWLFYCVKIQQQEDNINIYILNVAYIINNVLVPPEESELGAFFKDAQSGEQLRFIFMELGNKEPVTPLRTEN